MLRILLLPLVLHTPACGQEPLPPEPALVADWGAFATVAELEASGEFGQTRYDASLGEARPVRLAAPGPWGGTGALELHWEPGPVESQPQVGLSWRLPEPLPEVWLDGWIRFSDNWSNGESWADAEGNPREPDYKTLFLWQGDPPGDTWWPNFQFKSGVWGDQISAAWYPDDDPDTPGIDGWFEYASNPLNSNDGTLWNPDTRLRSNRPGGLQDGEWHRLQVHVRTGRGGLMDVWIDGTKVIESPALDLTTRKGGTEPVSRIWFGANRNVGIGPEPMSVFWSPVTLHTTDPGWSDGGRFAARPPLEVSPAAPPPEAAPPRPEPTRSAPPARSAPPPADAWVQGWDFPDGTIHTEWNDRSLSGGGDAGGEGNSYARTLDEPGPWGGTKVLENYYGVVPATSQPQVGTYWQLPEPVREMWLETWVKFGPNWEMLPDNPNYPGNVDHKLIFVMESWTNGQPYFPARWECKVGVWWTTMPCSAHDHDTFYQYMSNPPGGANPDRLDANVVAWDGRWHRLRMHLKMGEGDGRFEVWWDDLKTIDSGFMDMKTQDRAFHSILFGGNRNQGTDHPQSYFFGPGIVHRTDPGW